MPYVTDMNAQQIRAHMKKLQAMPGWHERLADRLYKEVLDRDARIVWLKQWLEEENRQLKNAYHDLTSTAWDSTK